jgi:hypothetical protein
VSKASIAFVTAVAVVMVCFLGCSALLLFVVIDASFNGELASGPGCGTDTDSSSPEGKWIWVAKDKDAFRILENLRHGSVAELQAAERRMNGRILPLGDGTQVRHKACLCFDGSRFRPDPPKSPEQERLQRVLKVKVKSGYADERPRPGLRT